MNLIATLAFVRGLAREVGHYLKPHAGGASAETKSDGTFVTAFDLESDKRITHAIRSRYPEHLIMSEESEKIYDGREWAWVIDPIDGTTNFTWGFPCWGVLIGLLHKGAPLLGVAEFPVTGETFFGATGTGAWRNGQPILASKSDTLTSNQTIGLCSRAAARVAFPLKAKARIAGSSGYDLAQVACGTFAGMYNQNTHVWDVAALWPLVHESGGYARALGPSPIFPLSAGTNLAKLKFQVAAAGSQAVLNQIEPALNTNEEAA